MAREATFNFEEEKMLVRGSRLLRRQGHTASINTKHGYISFSSDYVRDKTLHGKMIKLYADKSKKAIGWKILHENNLSELDGYRKVIVKEFTDKKGSSFKTCKLTIHALIKVLNVKNGSYLKLPIKTYRSPTMMNDAVDYVELKQYVD